MASTPVYNQTSQHLTLVLFITRPLAILLVHAPSQYLFSKRSIADCFWFFRNLDKLKASLPSECLHTTHACQPTCNVLCSAPNHFAPSLHVCNIKWSYTISHLLNLPVFTKLLFQCQFAFNVSFSCFFCFCVCVSGLIHFISFEWTHVSTHFLLLLHLHSGSHECCRTSQQLHSENRVKP